MNEPVKASAGVTLSDNLDRLQPGGVTHSTLHVGMPADNQCWLAVSAHADKQTSLICSLFTYMPHTLRHATVDCDMPQWMLLKDASTQHEASADLY